MLNVKSQPGPTDIQGYTDTFLKQCISEHPLQDDSWAPGRTMTMSALREQEHCNCKGTMRRKQKRT